MRKGGVSEWGDLGRRVRAFGTLVLGGVRWSAGRNRCAPKLGGGGVRVVDVEELERVDDLGRKDFITPRLARSLRSLARRGVDGGLETWRWR